MNKLYLKTLIVSGFTICALALTACVQPIVPVDSKNSDLTQGNIQMNLVVGKTTKAEILEKFGSPNITTRDGSGKEVWSYQRAAKVTQAASSSSGWNLLLIGAKSNQAGYSDTSSMTTLIIKFNSKDIVSDFNSRTSQF